MIPYIAQIINRKKFISTTLINGRSKNASYTGKGKCCVIGKG